MTISDAIDRTTDSDTDDTESMKSAANDGPAMQFTLTDSMMMMPFAEARATALRDFDRHFLSAALARHSGNVARTARALGLHRQSLQKLMARRGLKSGRVTQPAES